MPELTSEQVKQAIDDGNLTLLSLDTSIFDQYQNGLEHELLQRLAQFSGSGVNLILSDVIVREVRQHMVHAVSIGDKSLKDAIKKSGAARSLDTALRQEIMDGVTLQETPEACVNRRMASFQALTGHQIAITADLVTSGNLFLAYFDVKPPFENKDMKKYEFPDAMALQALVFTT